MNTVTLRITGLMGKSVKKVVLAVRLVFEERRFLALPPTFSQAEALNKLFSVPKRQSAEQLRQA